jgi:hypothetical protein
MSFIKPLIPFTHEALPPNLLTLGIGFQYMNFVGLQTFRQIHYLIYFKVIDDLNIAKHRKGTVKNMV